MIDQAIEDFVADNVVYLELRTTPKVSSICSKSSVGLDWTTSLLSNFVLRKSSVEVALQFGHSVSPG